MTTGSSHSPRTPHDRATDRALHPAIDDGASDDGASAAAGSTPGSESGRSPLYALTTDQRFSYCLYRPSSTKPDGLLIAVHGTERDAVGTREQFAPVARRLNLAVLAPLFPAAIDDPVDIDNYKFIEFHGTRFDRLLMAMVDEALERLDLPRTPPTYLCGFSGGAQFALRFFYLHPGMLRAVSIAAPGRITEIDDSANWWHGTADLADVFGSGIDRQALAAVPVHVAVGSEDRTPSVDRVSLAKRLAANLRAHGVGTRFDLVEGARHDLTELMPAVSGFVENVADRAPPTHASPPHLPSSPTRS